MDEAQSPDAENREERAARRERPWERALAAPVAGAFEAALEALRRYHRYEVRGLDRLPDRPFLLVTNHSLATYDIFLLNRAVARHCDREVRGLGDRLFFRNSLVRCVAHHIGAAEARPDIAHDLLERGDIPCVTPGGMLEALRPSSARYQLRWTYRRGFCRLAIDAGVPIVLAACPQADEILTVYPSSITSTVYRRWRAPAPLMRGVGPTLLPRPVRLVHHIAEPIEPPELDRGDSLPAATGSLHARVLRRMEELVERALDDSRDRTHTE
jgi:1-acyl-sn-glycerol-3-phosphate acyltransferase